MHEVTIFSKHELWPSISVVQEDFDLITQETEEVISGWPAQDHNTQQEL